MNLITAISVYIGSLQRISAFFGQGTGSLALNLVACDGNEGRLADCPSGSFYRSYCSHAHDAGVTCLPQAGIT